VHTNVRIVPPKLKEPGTPPRFQTKLGSNVNVPDETGEMAFSRFEPMLRNISQDPSFNRTTSGSVIPRGVIDSKEKRTPVSSLKLMPSLEVAL